LINLQDKTEIEGKDGLFSIKLEPIEAKVFLGYHHN
jgi:hypothetical protein